MINFTITLTGSAPMLMHNVQLADPLSPASRELAKLTSKRKKTYDDHMEVARAEFLGSLYTDPDVGPYVPGEWVMAALVSGGKLNKLGATVTRGVIITTDVNPLSYAHGTIRDSQQMWESELFAHRASVRVTTSRVIRTRARFMDWSVQADGVLDESQLDLSQLGQVAENAGLFCGIGTWRPRFGRFTSKVEQQ